MNQSQLNQTTEHVYWLPPDETTDRPVLGAIVGKYGALIVDAGNSPAHASLLLDELSKLGLARPKYVALTHWHWDHVFGASAFDLPIFAHQETKHFIEEMAGLDWSDDALDQRVEQGTEIEFCRDMIKAEWPDRAHLRLKPPDVSFDTHVEFDLGGVTCRFKHVGGCHSPDSSIAHVLEDKVVFLGDCLYEDIHHGPPNYTPQKLFPLIDEILNCNADYYLFAHGPGLMSKPRMVEFTTHLKSIGREVERVGCNRELIIQQLQKTTGRSLDEDDLGIVDAFLAGLRL
jgi:glyoxylase-like metal-dependent hydrolase (beta-lactamase superfamily II)